MPWTYHHIPLKTPEEFTQRVAAEIEQAILDAIEAKGHCVIGLSGGSTPRSIYEELGSLVVIPWEKVTIFLVDERFVPVSDDRSNQKLVRQTLLAGKGGKNIPERQRIFPDTSLLMEECVEEYEEKIHDLGEIDVVVLGMGEDGHIASLFPDDVDALLEEERLVIHTNTNIFDVHDRMTVTLPVLAGAAKQFFLLQGEKKKKMFTEIMVANEDCVEYPAHALLKTGKTTWVTTWEG